ncbi:MAG TPA: galactose oxidase-like domain-containing protein [Gemmatimonadales bacterium]|nr:galactose oxidase-like domain-containing protein [Gemmatimonadales bacterium]
MTRSTLFSRLGTLLLAGATITCSSNEPNKPPPEAAALAMAGGNSQSAPTGQALANPISVRVTDENGDPVSDVAVDWTAANGGSVSASSVPTDNDGRSGVTWTLGPTAGSQTATATVDGLEGSPVHFTATAVEAGEITLTVTRQPPTSALTAEVFTPETQPAVRLLDPEGAAMAGEAVTASVESGGGTLQGETTATTDANGIASFGDLGIAGNGAQVLAFSAAGASVSANAVNLQPLPSEATTGEWDAPVQWGTIVPLHMALLPTGKILAWGREELDGTMGQPRLWDPTSGSPEAMAVEVAADTMLFCAGHALMADGKLMVSGGHKLDDRGLDVTNIFDPVSEKWESGLPKMAKGRWYPTVTTLPDGRLVTVAGKDTSKQVVTIPEVWENDHWVQLPGASLTLPYYPRDFVDPKTGLVFMAGERVQSRWLDVDATGGSGRGRWSSGPSHIWPFNRDYGSAVMYETGKILYVGGGGYTGWDTPDPKSPTPTATAEKLDLMAGPPTWTSAGSMAQPRRHLNATVLPDGTVLVTGGVSGGGFNDIASAVHTAEQWNPATNTWTALAPNAIDRGYHSVSLLLPDGTVLHGASGDANIPGTTTKYPAQRNHEIFHPPYLFRGARPVISAAPTDVTYGADFKVTTTYAAQVTGVRWIHLGTVTHAFDQSARANTLAFTPEADGVSVTAPSGPNSAPPGHYLLFILNRNGVPSAGRIIRVH